MFVSVMRQDLHLTLYNWLPWHSGQEPLFDWLWLACGHVLCPDWLQWHFGWYQDYDWLQNSDEKFG